MANYSLNTPYIVLGGVTLAAIIIVFAIIQPMMADVAALQESTRSAQAALEDRRAFLRTIDQKSTQLQAQQVHEQRLNVILPTEKAYQDVVRVLHLAATDSGVVISKFIDHSSSARSAINAKRARGEKVSVPATLEPMSAQITLGGTYQQVRLFLERIEKMPRLIDVTSVTLDRNSTQPDQISAQVLVQFYFKK